MDSWYVRNPDGLTSDVILEHFQKNGLHFKGSSRARAHHRDTTVCVAVMHIKNNVKVLSVRTNGSKSAKAKNTDVSKHAEDFLIDLILENSSHRKTEDIEQIEIFINFSPCAIRDNGVPSCTIKLRALRDSLPAASTFKIRFVALYRIGRPTCRLLDQCECPTWQLDPLTDAFRILKSELGKSIHCFDQGDWERLLEILPRFDVSAGAFHNPELSTDELHHHYIACYLHNLHQFRQLADLRFYEDILLRLDIGILSLCLQVQECIGCTANFEQVDEQLHKNFVAKMKMVKSLIELQMKMNPIRVFTIVSLGPKARFLAGPCFYRPPNVFWWFYLISMVLNPNLDEATLASLRVLRYSRWPLKWPPKSKCVIYLPINGLKMSFKAPI